jgi:aminoglycoside phosphotransferase (APT) family kinase protein
MPSDTLTIPESIATIFTTHGLGDNLPAKRIKVGFTNEIHHVGDYILKVYARPDTAQISYDKEINLFEKLKGTVLVPELVAKDASRAIIPQPYIIYRYIDGRPAGHVWHLITHEQRRKVIQDGVGQLRAIAASEPHPKLIDYQTWREQIETKLNKYLDVVRQKNLFRSDIVKSLQAYIDENVGLLERATLGLQYWDFHLDNLIIEDGKLAGMIDFEHVDVVSIDYVLNIVRQMQQHPHLHLAEDMERYADVEHYKDILSWFKEFYPELFAFDELETRINLYDLEGMLRLRPSFPNAQQIDDRVARILNQR